MSASEDELRAQGRERLALAAAVLPVLPSGMALSVGALALAGHDPSSALGVAGSASIVAVIAIGWACRLAASRQGGTMTGLPAALRWVMALIISLAWLGLVLSAAAAMRGCDPAACGPGGGAFVTVGIVFGVFAVVATLGTIRFLRRAPRLSA